MPSSVHIEHILELTPNIARTPVQISFGNVLALGDLRVGIQHVALERNQVVERVAADAIDGARPEQAVTYDDRVDHDRAERDGKRHAHLFPELAEGRAQDPLGSSRPVARFHHAAEEVVLALVGPAALAPAHDALFAVQRIARLVVDVDEREAHALDIARNAARIHEVLEPLAVLCNKALLGGSGEMERCFIYINWFASSHSAAGAPNTKTPGA